MTDKPLYHYRSPLVILALILSIFLGVFSAWFSVSRLELAFTPPVSITNPPSTSDNQLLEYINQQLISPSLLTAPIPTATLIPELEPE